MCVHTYMHSNTYAHALACKHICIPTNIYACITTYISTHADTHAYIHSLYMHAHELIDTQLTTHMHAHTCTSKHNYVHIQTHRRCMYDEQSRVRGH